MNASRQTKKRQEQSAGLRRHEEYLRQKAEWLKAHPDSDALERDRALNEILWALMPH